MKSLLPAILTILFSFLVFSSSAAAEEDYNHEKYWVPMGPGMKSEWGCIKNVLMNVRTGARKPYKSCPQNFDNFYGPMSEAPKK